MFKEQMHILLVSQIATRQFGKYLLILMMYVAFHIILKMYTLNGDSFSEKSIPLLGTVKMTPLLGTVF